MSDESQHKRQHLNIGIKSGDYGSKPNIAPPAPTPKDPDTIILSRKALDGAKRLKPEPHHDGIYVSEEQNAVNETIDKILNGEIG